MWKIIRKLIFYIAYYYVVYNPFYNVGFNASGERTLTLVMDKWLLEPRTDVKLENLNWSITDQLNQ